MLCYGSRLPASCVPHLPEARRAACLGHTPARVPAPGRAYRVPWHCTHLRFQTADRLQRLPESMELIEYPEKMRQRMAEGKPVLLGTYL